MNNGSKHEIEVGDTDSPLKTASGELPMTEASQKTQDWLAERQEAAQWLASNKAQIFPLLKAARIALVTVAYSGCGGSGQIDYMLATGLKPESGPAPEIALPETKVTLRAPSFHDANAQEQLFSIREAIEQLWWELLEDRHAGWVNYEGGGGSFLLDVAAEHIKLDHCQFRSESITEW